MATNLVALNVYQINSKPGFGNVSSKRIAFPTQGFMVSDCSGNSSRSLSTGFNVYAALQAPNGTLYYVSETQAQVISAFNA